MKTRQWIEKDEFENQILKSTEPRIVLFVADWCSYCRRFLGVVSEYKLQTNTLQSPTDELAVVDIDSGDGSLWDTFNINLVPTIVVFFDGKEIFRRDGKPQIGLRKEDLEDALKTISSAKK